MMCMEIDENFAFEIFAKFCDIFPSDISPGKEIFLDKLYDKKLGINTCSIKIYFGDNGKNFELIEFNKPYKLFKFLENRGLVEK